MTKKGKQPYFCFIEKNIAQNLKLYKPNENIYYCTKTNCNPFVIDSLNKLNCNFCINTIEHFKILKKHKVDVNKICVINVLLDDKKLMYLYKNGVRFFTFDNYASLYNFSKYADISICKICLRFSTMNLYPNYPTHMGASTNEINKMIDLIQSKNGIYGIGIYISGKLKNNLNICNEFMSIIEKKYKDLSFVNIGGITPKIYQNITKTIKNIKTNLEIGTMIVESLFNLITNIVRFETKFDKNFLVIKNGLYTGLFDKLYTNRKYAIYLNSNNHEYKLLHNKNNKNQIEVLVYGGSSDSSDFIGTMYTNQQVLDSINSNSYITIKNVGAYFEQVFTNYCDEKKLRSYYEI